MGAHDARKRVAVRERECREVQRLRCGNQLFSMARPAQKAEIAGSNQLGVGAHAKNP